MMCVRYFPAVILGTVGLCVSLLQNRNVIKPTGPKMCDHICNQRVGCSSYIFNTVSLTCYLTNDSVNRHDSRNGMYLLQADKNDGKKRVRIKLKCRKNDKIYYTRRNRLQCKPVWKRQTAQQMKTRILILMSGIRSHRARQLHLQTNTIAPYPYISTQIVKAVAYISSSRTLLISSKKPHQLFCVRVDSRNKTILRRNCFFVGIAVDDVHHLVFLTSRSKTRGLFVMTTEGKKLKRLVNMIDYPGGVAVDPKLSLVYVVISSHSLDRFKYNGIAEGSIAMDDIGYSLSMDVDRNVLYYMKGIPRNIYKMFLSNYSSKNVVLSRPFDGNIYFYGNNLYLSSSVAGEVIEISESGRIQIVKTGLKQGVTLYFCAIP